MHVREQIEEYLQSGMDHAARARLEAHVTRCHSCRDAVEAAQDSSEAMRWLPNPEAAPSPGPDFYYRVQAAIEQQQSQGWLVSWTAGLQPRLTFPILMMGMLLLAWMVSLPQRGSAITAQDADGWEAVEYSSTDFVQMTYSDDRDEARHDRMMDNIFEAAETQ